MILENIGRVRFSVKKRCFGQEQTAFMATFGGEDSDLDDDELDSLNREGAVNRVVNETVLRRAIPVQRNLLGQVLPGQTSHYEEINKEVTYKATHHALNEEKLKHYIYPTNYEVRDYQFDIVKKALFENVLCAVPTGMGKTFIAGTVMLNFFLWTIRGKIIFMAPTRPLVAQQIKACLGITGIPHNETAILLDKSRKNREEIWACKRVFFTTPQVVENDLKRGALNPKDLVCLVIDEAHRATGSYAYTNVVKFIDRFNTSYRILALTATPGTDLESVQEVVNNLDISRIEIRTEESMDIAKYMKRKSQAKIEVAPIPEVVDIVEQLGIAILPILRQAVELGIYEDCDPSQINAFKAMQQSQKVVANPSIPEGIKWRNFFILQLLNHVGQMLKRIKIYGIRTFYNYFSNKHLEFTTKYGLGKSTNKLAAEFYYHPILKALSTQCENLLADTQFLGHGKLQHVRSELIDFFSQAKSDSRVIIFTELRESALEIVKSVDAMDSPHVRPHIFIGQARGKEGFDEVTFTRNNKPKGRKKIDRLKREEERLKNEEEKKKRKKQEALEREARRTGSSEEAQITGMTQKQQKEIIQKFKDGDYNVLVCTSIGEEGLDIGEVDLIICYDTTSSPVKNIQRMGRTGRKRDGKIVLLFSSNESYKFEQAMKDYANLQRLITQNFLEYQNSDRIIPPSVRPSCRKQYITVSEEDQEVNDMEDSEEVIRFATQCMLGKEPKKTRKTKQSKKEKRFFMPSDVETGIITANQLVYRVEEPKREHPTLDNLEYDSLDMSSPSKSDFEEPARKDYTSSQHFEQPPPNFILQTSSQASPAMSPRVTLSSKNKSKASSLPIPVGGELPTKASSVEMKVEHNLSRGSKTHMSDAKPLPPPLRDIENPQLRPENLCHDKKTSKQSLNPSYPSLVPFNIKAEPFSPEKIASDYTDSISLEHKIESDENRQSSPFSSKRQHIFNDFSNNNGGLLTSEERDFFQRNYSVDHTVAIDTIPNFSLYTKHVHVPHSTRNEGFLQLFRDLRNVDKARIIEMNRTRCIARGLQSGILDQEEEKCTFPSAMVENHEIEVLPRPLPDNDDLDNILGSDSDF
ncbi:MPH1 (YIR002C) [Zygosaccharomyces parabailii]|nr:MPH1 (YIR002C) [Zygosaccharomyces parabailii]